LADIENEGLKHVGKDLMIAGLVTTVRDSISKNGKPFMIFTIEDFSGTHEFALFGDKYVQFKGYIEMNAQIFIKGSGETSYRDADKLDINIKDIVFLADAVENQLSQVTFNLDAEMVNEELMHAIFDLVDERGKVKLAFKIMANGKEIKASSARYRLQMDDITKKKLEELDVSFRFN
jgi:DNA polymerase-3 subunit alpha